MRIAIGLAGLAVRLAAARAQRTRDHVVRAALDEVARRAREQNLAQPNDSPTPQDPQPPRS